MRSKPHSYYHVVSVDPALVPWMHASKKRTMGVYSSYKERAGAARNAATDTAAMTSKVSTRRIGRHAAPRAGAKVVVQLDRRLASILPWQVPSMYRPPGRFYATPATTLTQRGARARTQDGRCAAAQAAQGAFILQLSKSPEAPEAPMATKQTASSLTCNPA